MAPKPNFKSVTSPITSHFRKLTQLETIAKRAQEQVEIAEEKIQKEREQKEKDEKSRNENERIDAMTVLISFYYQFSS